MTTEIQALRSFRSPVRAPSVGARASARALVLEASIGTSTRAVKRPSGLRRLVASVVVCAAVVGGAFVVAGGLGGRSGVIERAEAAIDPRGRVLHVVARVVASDGTVSVGESWILPAGTGRTLTRSGPGLPDCLARESGLRCYDAARNVVDVYRYNPAAVEAGKRYAELPGYRIDQPESLHRALHAGYARLVGATELAGRSVWEIQLAVPWLDANGKATPRFDDATSPRLYLDHASYLPVAETFPDAGSTTTYETYEFLSRDARTLRALELPTRPGVRTVVHPVGEAPKG